MHWTRRLTNKQANQHVYKNISSTRTLAENTFRLFLSLDTWTFIQSVLFFVGGVFSSVSWTAAPLYIYISLCHSWVLTHQTHRLTFIGTFLIFITVQHTSVLSTILCLLHMYLSLYLLSLWFNEFVSVASMYLWTFYDIVLGIYRTRSSRSVMKQTKTIDNKTEPFCIALHKCILIWCIYTYIYLDVCFVFSSSLYRMHEHITTTHTHFSFSFSFVSFVFFYYSFSALWIKIDHHCDEFSLLCKETKSRALWQVAVKMKYVNHSPNEWVSIVHRCLAKDYVRTLFTACTTRTCMRVCWSRPFRPLIRCVNRSDTISYRKKTSGNRWSVTWAQYWRLTDRHSKRVQSANTMCDEKSGACSYPNRNNRIALNKKAESSTILGDLFGGQRINRICRSRSWMMDVSLRSRVLSTFCMLWFLVRRLCSINEHERSGECKYRWMCISLKTCSTQNSYKNRHL